MRFSWSSTRFSKLALAREAEAFLQCGQLRYGFVEVSCEACHEVRLVAFSCKGRGWCPSCTNRRAVESGAALESVLPRVRHRQWTLSCDGPA
jgi:hypothetical protein